MSNLILTIQIYGVENGLTVTVEKPFNGGQWKGFLTMRAPKRSEYIATNTVHLFEVLEKIVRTDVALKARMQLGALTDE